MILIQLRFPSLCSSNKNFGYFVVTLLPFLSGHINTSYGYRIMTIFSIKKGVVTTIHPMTTVLLIIEIILTPLPTLLSTWKAPMVTKSCINGQ